MGTVLVDVSLGFLKRGADMLFKNIKQSSSKGIAKKCIVEMFEGAPNSFVTSTTFRNEDVDMRIPLQASTKCMKNTDESRCEIF